MKRITIITMLMVLMLPVSAQHKFDPAKFRAELHQFIITEANLTQEEADKFFPVFDEMKMKQRKIHRSPKDFFHQKPISDAACKSAIVQRDNAEIQLKNIEKTYHERFMKILSPSKVFDILYAEAKFHRQFFKKAARKTE